MSLDPEVQRQIENWKPDCLGDCHEECPAYRPPLERAGHAGCEVTREFTYLKRPCTVFCLSMALKHCPLTPSCGHYGAWSAKDREQRLKAAREAEAPLKCAHCGGPLGGPDHGCITGGLLTEGEAVCSNECYDAHTGETDLSPKKYADGDPMYCAHCGRLLLKTEAGNTVMHKGPALNRDEACCSHVCYESERKKRAKAKKCSGCGKPLAAGAGYVTGERIPTGSLCCSPICYEELAKRTAAEEALNRR